MKCLVIMPFRIEFDAVFETVRTATITGTENLASCYWLKDVKAAGRITDDIVQGLGEAAFCVADVTGNNPNVMWEAGFAMALGKPMIFIGQEPEEVPFDLSHHRLLPYRPDALANLRVDLEEAVRQTVSRMGSARVRPLPAHLYWLGHDLARAIRLAMFEPQQNVELQKNLLGALHHLGCIQLPADDSRALILRSLAAVSGLPEIVGPDHRQLVGWIAQAKNDLGDRLAEAQGEFPAFPTPQERDAWLKESLAWVGFCNGKHG